jgi:hypothetical protein
MNSAARRTGEKTMKLSPGFRQTKQRGTNDQEYQIYLTFADDGKGGDITRGGAPLLTYEQWLAK